MKLRKIFAAAVCAMTVLAAWSTVPVGYADSVFEEEYDLSAYIHMEGDESDPFVSYNYYFGFENAVVVNKTMLFLPRADRMDENGVTDEMELVLCRPTEEDVVIPDRVGGMPVTRISSIAFDGNHTAKTVKLPETVDTLSLFLFQDTDIVSVNVPKAVKVIPKGFCRGCFDLENVELHDGLFAIDETAFTLGTWRLPDDMRRLLCESVSEYSAVFERDGIAYDYDMMSGQLICLNYCGDGEEVVIPDSICGVPVVRYGGENSVQKRIKSVTSITFPEHMNVIQFPKNQFPNLKKAEFLGQNITLTTAADNVSLPIEELTIPAASVHLDLKNTPALKRLSFTGTGSLELKGAFGGCGGLERVDLSENYTDITIGKAAFPSTGITALSIPCRANIGANAFAKCRALETVTLTDATVGMSAFEGCTSLVSAELSGNMTMERKAFGGCDSLKSITIDTGIPVNGRAFEDCAALSEINGIKAFDTKTGEFDTRLDGYIRANFNNVDNVGFVNEFIAAQVKKIVAENVGDDMSDMEKVKVLHDWVCDNAEYGTGLESSLWYHTDSAILFSGEAVCEGYAKLCSLLYHEAGLETCFAASADHSWNLVKVGGHWFHVDSTWDDQCGDRRRYFMGSDAEFAADGGSHSGWKAVKPSALHYFQPEELPICDAPMGDVNLDGEVTAADLVKLSRCLLGADKADEVLGDMTFDGRVDAFDIVRLRRKVIEG